LQQSEVVGLLLHLHY